MFFLCENNILYSVNCEYSMLKTACFQCENSMFTVRKQDIYKLRENSIF